MVQYVDKAALVAEVEKRIKSVEKRIKRNNSYSEEGVISWERDKSLYDSYNQFLSFINTLEVKEVDLDKEIKEEYLKYRHHGGRDNMLVILNEPQFNKIAKHFFELGLRTQKGE